MKIYSKILLLCVFLIAPFVNAADFTLTADGSTSEVICGDGRAMLQAGGDFGGGTFIIEIKVSTGVWQTIEGASFAAGPISREIVVRRNAVIRGTLSGSTDPDLTGLLGI